MVCTVWLFRYWPRHVTTSMIATHATATGHSIRLEYVGQSMDNFFTPPDLLGSLHTKTDLPWYCQTTSKKHHQWILEKQEVNFPPAEGDFCDIHGVCGQRSASSTSSTLPFWTVLPFSPVVVQNYDSDSSDHTTGKSQPKILEAQGKH
jgi:hypothetical protein